MFISQSTRLGLKKFCILGVLCLFAGSLPGIRPAGAKSRQIARQIDFNRDVRPILSENCLSCHGPDAATKKIKLRLDSEAAAKADLGGGRRAIVPGDLQRSELVRRITEPDEMMRMPPPSATHKLTAKHIEILKTWIEQGGGWQQHWSFVKPVKALLPEVKQGNRASNAIDHFVLSRLERERLAPSPEADRATLLRRVSLDLTGLPPTPAEIDAFLADKAENAYEKVVDRLLASPRYGERMTFRWLDAARYADTNGYQIDGDRSAWRWRDWVIDAFNRNMPYDRFIIEQLAGDLLSQPTLDQRIATAFNRNHRINAEGGIVPEEYRVEYVVDRIDTTSTVFMGLTLGCARCHNHKYDPFTQKEYYQLSAYFNSIDEDGHSFDQGNSPPVMAAPTLLQQEGLRRYDEKIAKLESRIVALTARHREARQQWEQSLGKAAKMKRQWFPEENLLAYLSLDDQTTPILNKSDRPHHEQYNRKPGDPEIKYEPVYRDGAPASVDSPVGRGAVFDGKLYYDAGIRCDFRYKSTSGDYRERFTIAAWVYPETEQAGSIITKVSDDPAEIENNIPRAEGYGLYFLNGKVHFNMVFRWGEDTLRAETESPLPLRQWHHVAVVFDGLKQWEERLRIYVNGREAKLRFNQRNFYLLFGGTKQPLRIGAGGGPQFRFKGAIDDALFYSRALQPIEIAAMACAEQPEKIASLPAGKRSHGQQYKLDRLYLSQAAPQELKDATRELWQLRRENLQFQDQLPTLMVMEEMSAPRPAFLLKRGAYDAPDERVERAVPASLLPMPAAFPQNRLGFAKWLAHFDHPLTSRVAVNRFWQMLFGAGLVKTTEDFGSQGEMPSHPELLDWLSVEFQESGWDVKRLLKMIVMSSTYRQSSRLTPQLMQVDPDNRLLARGPRYRLPAEMIRDQALLVSGLLVEKLGGPSVKPYQPDGLYNDMAFQGLTKYDRDKGEGLWRRSLYSFWKRTVLAPTMQVFDASAREFCTVRDTRTNTPLQSLNLMNDVTYIETSRLLAERMIKEGGAAPRERLAWAFRSVTSRVPSAAEIDILLRNWNRQVEYYTARLHETGRLLSIGERRNDEKLDRPELAAYTASASLILNLDEAITKQ
jgi:hypothetical protein